MFKYLMFNTILQTLLLRLVRHSLIQYVQHCLEECQWILNNFGEFHKLFCHKIFQRSILSSRLFQLSHHPVSESNIFYAYTQGSRSCPWKVFKGLKNHVLDVAQKWNLKFVSFLWYCIICWSEFSTPSTLFWTKIWRKTLLSMDHDK